MTLGFLSGSKNFCKLLSVSWEVFTETTGSIGWPSPAPRLHIGDCLDIRSCHWRPCDLLVVIKSPNFSARGTAPPLRLLLGALVILVLWQISQFRSLGKWVWTLCLPISSRLLSMDSKDSSWEELEWESPCTGISSSTKFSLNSCSHSTISELARPESANNGSPRYILGSFFIWFWICIGLVNIGSPWSLINRSWHSYWRNVTFNSILSFSSLNFTYWRWWRRTGRRCWAMPPLSWKGPRSWWVRSRRRIWYAWNHKKNHVSVMQGIRIPFSMRCGFWPLIHSYPFSSQSFPSDNTAGVFSRTFTVKNISNSLTHTVASNASALLHWRLWLSLDCTISSRYPFQHHSNPYCWSHALTHQSRQQILVPQV